MWQMELQCGVNVSSGAYELVKSAKYFPYIKIRRLIDWDFNRKTTKKKLYLFTRIIV